MNFLSYWYNREMTLKVKDIRSNVRFKVNQFFKGHINWFSLKTITTLKKLNLSKWKLLFVHNILQMGFVFTSCLQLIGTLLFVWKWNINTESFERKSVHGILNDTVLFLCTSWNEQRLCKQSPDSLSY